VTANDLTVLDLLDALLHINSVNPGLDPDGAGEAGIAAFVAGWGRAAGLRTQVLEGTPGRPSVILRGGQNTGGHRLLLSGHLDTVGLAGTRDPLTPRVAGDRLPTGQHPRLQNAGSGRVAVAATESEPGRSLTRGAGGMGSDQGDGGRSEPRATAGSRRWTRAGLGAGHLHRAGHGDTRLMELAQGAELGVRPSCDINAAF